MKKKIQSTKRILYLMQLIQKKIYLHAWCGYGRYTMMMENENELFMIVFILEINLKIKHNRNKYNNVIYTYTPSRTRKHI